MDHDHDITTDYSLAIGKQWWQEVDDPPYRTFPLYFRSPLDIIHLF